MFNRPGAACGNVLGSRGISEEATRLTNEPTRYTPHLIYRVIEHQFSVSTWAAIITFLCFRQ